MLLVHLWIIWCDLSQRSRLVAFKQSQVRAWRLLRQQRKSCFRTRCIMGINTPAVGNERNNITFWEMASISRKNFWTCASLAFGWEDWYHSQVCATHEVGTSRWVAKSSRKQGSQLAGDDGDVTSCVFTLCTNRNIMMTELGQSPASSRCTCCIHTAEAEWRLSSYKR